MVDTSSPSPYRLLIEQIRLGKPDAWSQLIAEFEGRLLSFVDSRIRNRAAAEDIVQETFIGFLTSLPNYDVTRPLESYLFTIAAYKLTDHLRREGRRPTLPISSAAGESAGDWDLPGNARGASSIARSGERHQLEEIAISASISDQIQKWQKKPDFKKMKCMELLFTSGLGNKETAEKLALTEQQVANFKFDFLEHLRKQIRTQRLSEEVFPELYEKQ